MTIQEYAASALEKSVEDLIEASNSLPKDQWAWKPLDKGRTVLDQLAECAATNALTAKVVAAAFWEESMMPDYWQTIASVETPETAITVLREATASLIKSIRETTDANLAAEVKLHHETVTLAQLFLMPLWNMSYHEGQINYIDTLR